MSIVPSAAPAAPSPTRDVSQDVHLLDDALRFLEAGLTNPAQ
jgi:hypothetical protein